MDATLPIVAGLPALRTHLASAPLTVLQAPPGAGKSTALPLALLDEPWLRGQRIVLLEPRRLAARSVAGRMAQVLQENVGETVGYRVRFEQRVSARTRIEAVTEGVLTRRLQDDPGLHGVGLVVFDEFHERGLEADLALTLCREVQRHLRADLRLLIMSATLDDGALRAALEDPPFVNVPGRQHPVSVRHLARDPEGPLAVSIATATARALAEAPGDVLVFLPGLSEILRAREALAEQHPDLAILPLHGDLSLDAQQAALDPDPRGRRKVILATSIAETSLTIEGIGVVIDSGFARVPRFDARTGLTRLATTRITADSAEQRAGRAGRLGPGLCLRLWSAETQARLLPARRPEILEADLASLRLELAQWGAAASDLRWVTPPPPGALRQAGDLLEALGALEAGRLTHAGRGLLETPTHPRLAHVLQAAPGPLAADVVALLDERDPFPRGSGADLSLRVEALRRHRLGQSSAGDIRALDRIERLAGLWRRRLGVRADNGPVDPEAVGALIAQAYPDRIAQARGAASGRYRLANGRGVRLPEGDPLLHAPWLAVAGLDDGGDEGVIHEAAPLQVSEVERLARTREVVGWDARAGVLAARQEHHLGALILSTRPLAALPPERRAAGLREAVQSEGLDLLRWSEEARTWQARALSARVWRGEAWPDLSDDALRADPDAWLAGWWDDTRSRADFARIDVVGALRARLDARQIKALDELAPTHLAVPSGSRIRLAYFPDGRPPVLAVKLQELFGLADTPTVDGGRRAVVLHLLSPAGRPIQVTQDLRGFWDKTYPAVRRELRGRYNKHPWPEDPWAATPTRKTVKGARSA
ncbi:MAG: ATP-dependent helicase HrpB [Thermoflexales bacterium]|nr:ATP-dependent helicase HrpB [Thermoflexales bacterium]